KAGNCIRGEPILRTKGPPALSHHAFSTVFSRVPGCVSDDHDSTATEATNRLPQGLGVVLGIMKGSVEYGQVELTLCKWKTIHLGLKSWEQIRQFLAIVSS